MPNKQSLQQQVEALRDLAQESKDFQQPHRGNSPSGRTAEEKYCIAHGNLAAYERVLTLIKQHEANRPSVEEAVEQMLPRIYFWGQRKLNDAELISDIKAILLSLSPTTKEGQ